MTAVRIGTLILAPSLLASLLSPGDLPFEKGRAGVIPGLPRAGAAAVRRRVGRSRAWL